MAREKEEDLPRKVLAGLSWAFGGPTFPSRGEFDAAVRASAHDEDTWAPDEVVIPRPHVKVMYITWVGDEQVEPEVDLTTDDGGPFTAGELMFKLHNAITAAVSNIDHRYFEGLTLMRAVDPNEVPLYHLRQGN
jgi:hypothetical protein